MANYYPWVNVSPFTTTNALTFSLAIQWVLKDMRYSPGIIFEGQNP